MKIFSIQGLKPTFILFFDFLSFFDILLFQHYQDKPPLYLHVHTWYIPDDFRDVVKGKLLNLKDNMKWNLKMFLYFFVTTEAALCWFNSERHFFVGHLEPQEKSENQFRKGDVTSAEGEQDSVLEPDEEDRPWLG